MNYFVSDKNTLVWFYFIVYTITVLFIVPNTIKPDSKILPIDTSNEKELQFGFRLILRIALLFPVLILLKNAI